MGTQTDILQIGYTGLGGTIEILRQNEEQLRTRFSSRFLQAVSAYQKELLLDDYQWKQVRQMVGTSGILLPIHDGGILAALWEIADAREGKNREEGLRGQQARVGVEASFADMPVKQETIELCEYAGFHPYEMSDYGGALALTTDSAEMIELLELQGLHGKVIGQITRRNQRVVLQGDETRFLEKPRRRQYEKTDFKMH